MKRGELWERLAAIVFPCTCVFCGAAVEYEDELCGRCPVPHREQIVPGGEDWAFRAAVSPLVYTGGAKNAVLALKRKPDRRTAGCLAGMMERSFRRYCEDVTPGWIVPVPQSALNLKRSGHNHAGVLANALGSLMEIPVREDLLVRSDHSEKQSALDRTRRVGNARRSYHRAPGAELHAGTVLLVDDVFTTGATAEICAGALLAAGAGMVYVLTAAKT